MDLRTRSVRTGRSQNRIEHFGQFAGLKFEFPSYLVADLVGSQQVNIEKESIRGQLWCAQQLFWGQLQQVGSDRGRHGDVLAEKREKNGRETSGGSFRHLSTKGALVHYSTLPCPSEGHLWTITSVWKVFQESEDSYAACLPTEPQKHQSEILRSTSRFEGVHFQIFQH